MASSAAKAPRNAGGGLTPKQKRFVDEYLIDLNATQAATRAGYSARTANEQGARLLAKVSVRSAVSAAKQKRAERTEITADRVLREYAKLAFLDPRAFFDDAGHLIDVAKLPADVAAALAGMDVTTERVGEDEEGRPQYAQIRKVKFTDKKGALDSIARHLGMFNDKLAVTGANGGPVQSVSMSPKEFQEIARGVAGEV
jgi:phage terminase small subunit